MAIPAVSTAATLSLRDCKQAASLSEIRSSTSHQGDLGEEGPLGETAGELKADDRSLAAKVVLALEAEGTGAAGQLRPRRHAIARTNPRDALSNLDDSGAEFMAEELHGGLGLEPALDGLIGEGRDAEGELGLGDAGLNAERFGDHVARPANRLGHVVEPHVAETVESPGFHDRLLTQPRKFLERVAVGGDACLDCRRPTRSPRRRRGRRANRGRDRAERRSRRVHTGSTRRPSGRAAGRHGRRR